MKLAIFGAGGQGSETAEFAFANSINDITFVVDDEFVADSKQDGFPIIPFSEVDIEKYSWIIAVGDPLLREKTADKLGPNARFATLIHPTSVIIRSAIIEEGSIIGQFVSISTNAKIGRHTIVSPFSVVGHDSEIGNFVTLSPGVGVMGNCKVGDRVFMGASSCLRDGKVIADDVYVGMGSIVVKDLSTGTYLGNPARKID